VDCVTVKGSRQPVGLFTYDLDAGAAAEIAEAMLRGHWPPSNRQAGGTAWAVGAAATAAVQVPVAAAAAVQGSAVAVSAQLRQHLRRSNDDHEVQESVGGGASIPPAGWCQKSPRLPPLRQSVVARAAAHLSSATAHDTGAVGAGSAVPRVASSSAAAPAAAAVPPMASAAARARASVVCMQPRAVGGTSAAPSIPTHNCEGEGADDSGSDSGDQGQGDEADALIGGRGGGGGGSVDDWVDNPLVTDTWGLDWGFKAAWDSAIAVGAGSHGGRHTQWMANRACWTAGRPRVGLRWHVLWRCFSCLSRRI
jgi:hypothetical protein